MDGADDAGRDVHAIAHQVTPPNHDVADMDPDAQWQRVGSGGLLDFQRRRHGLHGAGELDEEAVAHLLEEAAGVAGDHWLNDLATQRRQARQRSTLVLAAQARVADHISYKDRGEAALLFHSGSPTNFNGPTSASRSS
jgi:hypothetical protein